MIEIFALAFSAGYEELASMLLYGVGIALIGIATILVAWR